MSGIAGTIAKRIFALSPVLLSAYVEGKFVSPAVRGKLFGLVILINLVWSSFTLVGLSMKAGKARKDFDVPLPNQYADSSHGENGVKFNNVQRGHHNALETFPIYLGLSLVSGFRFPVTTAAMGLLWCISRNAWAEGYVQQGAAGRYEYSSLGKHVWTPLIVMSLLCGFTAVEMLADIPNVM